MSSEPERQGTSVPDPSVRPRDAEVRSDPSVCPRDAEVSAARPRAFPPSVAAGSGADAVRPGDAASGAVVRSVDACPGTAASSAGVGVAAPVTPAVSRPRSRSSTPPPPSPRGAGLRHGTAKVLASPALASPAGVFSCEFDRLAGTACHPAKMCEEGHTMAYFPSPSVLFNGHFDFECSQCGDDIESDRALLFCAPCESARCGTCVVEACRFRTYPMHLGSSCLAVENAILATLLEDSAASPQLLADT